MYVFTIVTLTSLSVLAAAKPILGITSRAGGPAFKPLADNCTFYDPLSDTTYHGDNLNATGPAVNGFKPTADLSSSIIYSYYLSQPDYVDADTRSKGCIEQCNGLSGCRAILFGHDVPTPEGYYGGQGGTPSVACLMFSRPISAEDFESVQDGAYTAERAGNIECPA